MLHWKFAEMAAKPLCTAGGMFDDVLHEGQVQSFDFDWERQSPELRWSRVEIAAA